MNIKRIIILIITIPILMFIFRYVQLNKADIINTINGMSLEKVKTQYNSYTVNDEVTVPFKEVGRSLNFDVKIVESIEKNSIKIHDEVFKPKKSHKYVLIKFKFKIHNLSNGKDDFGLYDFGGLVSTKNNFHTNSNRNLEKKIYWAKKKNDTNLIWTSKVKPGVIKYRYGLFEIPKSCQLKDLILTDTGYNNQIKFKIK